MANVTVTDRDCQETRPGLLFSDRAWPLKMGLALALFALLCGRASREISELQPEIEEGAIRIDHVRGSLIHVWARRVLTVTADGFDIDTKIGPFHVTSPFPAPTVGQYVSVVGEFVEPRHLAARGVQVNAGYLWKRGTNYGLSAATVLVFLWIVRKRFRWRPGGGLLRSRY
jgi:hypothetical protein